MSDEESANARWSRERAWKWREEVGWLRGFNYLPSSAVNSTEMWQSESFDAKTIARELSWAREIGFNSCRVFLQFLVWENEGEKFLNRFEEFLEIAAGNEISVMPILFDDCAFSGREPYLGIQNAPVVGVHNSGWTASPGLSRATNKAYWPRLREYSQSVLSRFQNDARISLWDIYNEPGNAIENDATLPLLEEVFKWAREVAPSQPLTCAVWDEVSNAREFSLSNSDVISFHLYEPDAKLRSKISDLQKHNRPILCSEWMARTLGSTLQNQIPIFRKSGVGCYLWGFVNGRTQTHLPWEWSLESGEPEMWFHDLMHENGTPYRAEEVEFLRAQFAKGE